MTETFIKKRRKISSIPEPTSKEVVTAVKQFLNSGGNITHLDPSKSAVDFSNLSSGSIEDDTIGNTGNPVVEFLTDFLGEH